MEICSAASGTTLAVLEDVEGQTAKAVKQRLAIDLGISRFRQRMLSTHVGILFCFLVPVRFRANHNNKVVDLDAASKFLFTIIIDIFIFYFLGKATSEDLRGRWFPRNGGS